MRIAALYDIHANLPALDAVLDELLTLGVDLIVVGGDVVPGPLPRETFDRLAAIDVPVRWILGNGDRVVLAYLRGEEPTEIPAQFRAAIRWNAAQLGPEHARLMGGWAATLTVESTSGPVLFCHATPRSDVEIFTRETTDARVAAAFDGVDARLVVCGHTHMQFDRHVNGIRVLNAGSVGMPFGDPGAYWLLLDGDAQLRRTEYNYSRAAERIRATQYPDAEQFAARNVLEPPSEAAMLAAFSRS